MKKLFILFISLIVLCGCSSKNVKVGNRDINPDELYNKIDNVLGELPKTLRLVDGEGEIFTKVCDPPEDIQSLGFTWEINNEDGFYYIRADEYDGSHDYFILGAEKQNELEYKLEIIRWKRDPDIFHEKKHIEETLGNLIIPRKPGSLTIQKTDRDNAVKVRSSVTSFYIGSENYDQLPECKQTILEADLTEYKEKIENGIKSFPTSWISVITADSARKRFETMEADKGYFVPVDENNDPFGKIEIIYKEALYWIKITDLDHIIYNNILWDINYSPDVVSFQILSGRIINSGSGDNLIQIGVRGDNTLVFNLNNQAGNIPTMASVNDLGFFVPDINKEDYTRIKVSIMEGIDYPDEFLKRLTIEGDQIWVRDFPGVGNVIAKVDNGTRCEIIEKGHFEIIRGKPDYWYKIFFPGGQDSKNNDYAIEGWVFGSQSDKKIEYQVISSNSADHLWVSFYSFMEKSCETWSEENQNNDNPMKCEINKIDNNKFSISYLYVYEEIEVEDYGSPLHTEVTYTRHPNDDPDIQIIAVNNRYWDQGPAGNNYYMLMATVKSNDQFKLYVGQDENDPVALDGKLFEMVDLSPAERILITYQEIVSYYLEAYYNVYYIDINNETMQLKLAKIGHTESLVEEEIWEMDEGRVIVESATVEVVTTSPLKLKLTEHKAKKSGDALVKISDQNIKYYTWDQSKKVFILE